MKICSVQERRKSARGGPSNYMIAYFSVTNAFIQKVTYNVILGSHSIYHSCSQTMVYVSLRLYKWLGNMWAAASWHKRLDNSPPTAGVPSSLLGHSMWVLWWTKQGLGRFFTGFLPFSPTTNFIPPFLHTHLIHFISPCDCASGVVGRHPCYSRTYNIGASSHLIPRPDLVLDTSWGYLFILFIQL